MSFPGVLCVLGLFLSPLSPTPPPLLPLLPLLPFLPLLFFNVDVIYVEFILMCDKGMESISSFNKWLFSFYTSLY